MLLLPGLSPVSGKKVVVNFDGGLLSSDGGVLALREIERRLRVAERMTTCLKDPRDPGQITHTLTMNIYANSPHCAALIVRFGRVLPEQLLLDQTSRR